MTTVADWRAAPPPAADLSPGQVGGGRSRRSADAIVYARMILSAG
ncbi:hypothetical protein ACVILL_000002 [Bradyrhizobium sp. USDA 3364]